MNTFVPRWVRRVAVLLTIMMSFTAMVPAVHGGLVVSQPLAASDSQPQDLAKIQQLLELKVVITRLESLGFTQDEVQQRLERSSKADLHQFVVQSDHLIAGSDDGLAVVVTVLVIVLLVILILKVADKEIVVT